MNSLEFSKLPEPVKLATLWVFCVEYHSGINSRGYRLQCRLNRKVEKWAGRDGFTKTWPWAKSTMNRRFYAHLVVHYSEFV